MNLENIPAELKRYRNWVAYKIVERGGKSTKIPYNALRVNEKASTNDPETWCDFDDALTGLSSGNYDGLGFVFEKEAQITGIDIDHCIDGDGVLSDHASDWVNACDSYTEISPSGTGLHILVRGNIDGKGAKREIGEIYDDGRFFTITGNVWGERKSLRYAQEQITRIHAAIANDKPQGKQDTPDLKLVETPDAGTTKEEDLQIIKAFCQDFGCNALWEKRVKFNSQNEYDLSIATRAFKRNFNSNAVVRLLQLHRAKWNENPDKAYRTDYLDRTLKKAQNITTGNDSELLPMPDPTEGYFSDAADLASKPKPIKWLVKGYIPDNGIIWLFGRESSYKTFVALDLIYHVALGLPWRNTKTNQGSIVYVAGEGVGGLGKRLAALESHYKQTIPANAIKITRGSVFINDPESLNHLIANLRPLHEKTPISMIVIDTKSANMKGSDNDAGVINDWINTLRQFEQEFKATVLVIDHVGIGDQTRMRGSTHQAGAADAAYLIHRPDADNKAITFETHKDPKDFETPPPIGFHPKVIKLPPQWNDDDGVAQTSLVMVKDEKATRDHSFPRKTKHKSEALTLIENLYAEAAKNLEGTDREPRLEYKQINKALNAAGIGGKNYGRVLKNLIEKGELYQEGVFVYLSKTTY